MHHLKRIDGQSDSDEGETRHPHERTDSDGRPQDRSLNYFSPGRPTSNSTAEYEGQNLLGHRGGRCVKCLNQNQTAKEDAQYLHRILYKYQRVKLDGRRSRERHLLIDTIRRSQAS